MSTSSLLEAARSGDEQAFAELIAPFRRELHLHCYRMLGSLTDADELLQETMIAAWRGLGDFAARSSLRTWLYRVATNRCLNAIRDAKRRCPEIPVPPFEPPEPSRRGEVTWLQPYPDAWLKSASDPSACYQAGESVRLAFIVALQRLPPRQSAAVILCDALDFSFAETAAMLGLTPTAVKGLLQRGRAQLKRTRLADTAPAPARRAEANLAERFQEAYSADDVDAVVALLTDDAWLAMPPAPHEYHGTNAIAAFLRVSTAGRAGRRLQLLATRANGQPAFTCHLSAPHDRAAEPSGVVVLTPAGNHIAGITRFLDPRLSAHFDPDSSTP